MRFQETPIRSNYLYVRIIIRTVDGDGKPQLSRCKVRSLHCTRKNPKLINKVKSDRLTTDY
ncbi:MAG: hypothetical protein RM338_05035 [Nostoc sp. DedQUE12a]|nr:hypothetical protein [Nostoc sp. DedQUE12a]